MKTTRYFEEQVLRKRPYIQRSWCAFAIAAPLRRTVQPDGRIRFWADVLVSGETTPRVLRVITLEDGRPSTTPFSTEASAGTRHEVALLP